MTKTSTVLSAAGPEPRFAHEGYSPVESRAMIVSDLENATVYGRDDVTIGTISALMAAADGRITDVVIDIGGFLGMGTRSVSMPFDELTVLRRTQKVRGDDLRVYVDATEDALKAMPQHDG